MRKSMEDGPMRAALEQLWAQMRERATERFEALVTASTRWLGGYDRLGSMAWRFTKVSEIIL